jgi:adenylyltransferase/sulfurtransferase
MALAARSLRRYSRHLLIPEVGLAGQERLREARVLVVGAGGLGSPVLAYLAAAGIGRLGVCDDDRVDETNLQRQVIFSMGDLGRPKVEAAAERIVALNPDVRVDRIPLRFDPSNARELVRLYDVVVDASDRFETRYLVNDACRLEGKPDIYGSIFRFDGHVSVFAPAGPCYRCLFPQAPPDGAVPSCAEGGVLGALAGIVGTWQASEALKVILGIGRPLIGRLMLVDALDARVREVEVPRDPACALCGDAPSIHDALTPSERPAAIAVREIPSSELDGLIAGSAALVLDVREPHEAVLGVLEGAVHIPASQLDARLHELDSAKTYVVACRVGAKSRWAAQRLHDAGFRKLYHLSDGLLAYAVLAPDFEFF